MDEVEVLQLDDDKLVKYNNFLLEYKNFNELNENPFELEDNGIFSILSYSPIKKIYVLNDAPILYIQYKKNANKYKIETLIVSKEILNSRNAIECLYEKLKQDLLVSGKIFKEPIFTYSIKENDINSKILEALGFNVIKNHKIMEINLDEYIKKESMNKIKGPDLSNLLYIKSLSKKRDFEDRVRVQNLIFDNKNRVPLTILDVMSERNYPSYVDNLALLLCSNSEALGYGQILKYTNDYFLVNFGIVPEHRGKGYSSFFLEKMLVESVKEGIKKIKLEVLTENKAAVNLYFKHGFKELYNLVNYNYTK